jgi:diaminohydroxyphosphoribosylaminopyrimidine deaminase/5-amino-6-(5-phosphoribosylamino)uracil reductase
MIARRGAGRVSPNPLVGCVLVKDGQVIGEGAHEIYGGLHAEANALENARLSGHDPAGATAYLTLEPCNHTGRTMPCVDRLIDAKIARCVIAVNDPNPTVKGGGGEALKAAGIEVVLGLMETEARDLARFFFKHITTGLPFVTLKIAQSMDGKSALRSGRSVWITSEASRRRVHQMRAEFDAVLVGSNTVLADDPQLTVRAVEGRQPLRIAIDSKFRIPMTAKIFDGAAKTWIITTKDPASIISFDALTERGVEIIHVQPKDGRVDLSDMLKVFGDRGVQSIMVEPGPTLAGAFITQGLVDELSIFQSPSILGSEGRNSVAGIDQAGMIRKAELIEQTKIEGSSDCFLRYRVRNQ